MRFDVEKQNFTSLVESGQTKSSEIFIHEEIRPLLNRVETSHYNKGHMIFSEGKIVRGIYQVHYGKVKVYKQGSDGKKLIMNLCKPGDFIGYRCLFMGNYPSSVSAEILENASLSYFPREEFMQYVNSNKNIMSYFSQLLVRELEYVQDKIAGMAYMPVRGRLAETLLTLDGLYTDDACIADEGVTKKNGICVSREDLAGMIGTVKETVIRLLSEFKLSGLVKTRGKSIIILKPKGLMKINEMYR